jgi:hypothetical protein
VFFTALSAATGWSRRSGVDLCEGREALLGQRGADTANAR